VREAAWRGGDAGPRVCRNTAACVSRVIPTRFLTTRSTSPPSPGARRRCFSWGLMVLTIPRGMLLLPEPDSSRETSAESSASGRLRRPPMWSSNRASPFSARLSWRRKQRPRTSSGCEKFMDGGGNRAATCLPAPRSAANARGAHRSEPRAAADFVEAAPNRGALLNRQSPSTTGLFAPFWPRPQYSDFHQDPLLESNRRPHLVAPGLKRRTLARFDTGDPRGHRKELRQGAPGCPCQAGWGAGPDSQIARFLEILPTDWRPLDREPRYGNR